MHKAVDRTPDSCRGQRSISAGLRNCESMEYFAPAPMDMLNDLYLGLSVVAFALIIWLIMLLVKDPKGVVKAALFKVK